MFMKRGGIFLAMTIIIALVVAACGGGEATPTPRPQPTLAPTATPAPTATLEAAATQAPGAPTPTARPLATATPTPVLPTATPAVDEPKYGGTLSSGSIGTAVATGHFRLLVNDPQDNVSWFGVHSAYNTLLTLDTYQESKILVGGLAESWDVSSDGTKFTLHLRKDVKWHDGMPFTSKDVIYSYGLYSGDAPWPQREPQVAWYTENLVSKTAPDDFTVVLETRNPSASFVTRMTYYQLLMQPSHMTLEELITNPVGTGPYMFDTFQRDISSEWVRNPNYWDKDSAGRQLPYLDKMTWFQFADNSIMESAFRTAQIQWLGPFEASITASARERFIKNIPGLWINKQAAGNFGFLFANVAPWNIPEVREAISLFIDRKQVGDVGWKGFGSFYPAYMLPQDTGGKWGLPPEEIMSRPGYRYLDADGNLIDSLEKLEAKRDEMVKDPADIARARELLREVGLEDIGKVAMRTQQSAITTGGPVAVSQLIELFGKGPIMEPQKSFPQYYGDLFQGKFELAFMPYNGFGADEPYVTTDFLRSTSGSNYPILARKWDPNLEIDRLLILQEQTLDFVKRKEIIWDLQRAMLDHPSVIIVFANDSHSAARPEVKNPPPATSSFANYFQMERLWLDQ